MAKKNFQGVPDDYATTGWGKISPPPNKNGECFCGVDHSKEGWLPEPKSPQSVASMDKLMKDIYGGVPYKPPVDPVLIKGKGGFWGNFFDPSSTPDSTVPIKQIRVDVKPEITGYSDQKNGFKKHSFGVSMPEYSDITESQLRKILMDGFLKITDDIIKNIKEQNK